MSVSLCAQLLFHAYEKKVFLRPWNPNKLYLDWGLDTRPKVSLANPRPGVIFKIQEGDLPTEQMLNYNEKDLFPQKWIKRPCLLLCSALCILMALYPAEKEMMSLPLAQSLSQEYSLDVARVTLAILGCLLAYASVFSLVWASSRPKTVFLVITACLVALVVVFRPPSILF